MRRRFDDLMLGSLELFCLAAELESFTAAAAAAGVTSAAVSRSVARLETRLGARLFQRSTRRIRLTEAGERYLAHCRAALAELADAEHEIGGGQAEPRGRLRLSLPGSYAHYRVLPLLPGFRSRHPGLSFDLHVGNRNVDLTGEGFDLAIRARPPADSGLIARKLEDAELVVVAAPDYLERAGTPRRPEELDGRECIQFELPRDGRPVPWLFRDGDRDVEIETSGAVVCAEDVLAGLTLARAGGGLYQTYRFVAEADLAAGRLVEVLEGYGGRSRPFSLLYAPGRPLPLGLRRLIDFLVERLGGDGRGPGPLPD